MMPSLPKLIALALVLWTVWKVFRMIERRKEVARSETDESAGSKSSEQTSAGAEKKERVTRSRGVSGLWLLGDSAL